MNKGSARWYVRMLVCAFVVAVITVMLAGPAHAEEGSAPADGSASSERSDDGEDYGWLYRKGGYLYALDGEDSEPQFGIAHGRIYDVDTYQAQLYLHENQSVSEHLFSDGSLTYNRDLSLDRTAITSGKDITWSHTIPLALSRYIAFPKIRALGYGSHNATEVTRVVFDDTLAGYWSVGPDGAAAMAQGNDRLVYLDRWFEGCVNLRQIEGLSNVSATGVQSMARMFADCEQLEELDLSSFDTSSCVNFGGMFDGCDSLVSLTFGAGWTQAGAEDTEEHPWPGIERETADQTIHDDERYCYDDGTLCIGVGYRDDRDYGKAYEDEASRKATFPVDMCCVRDGQTVTYHAGDVIPDGAATYTVVGRTNINRCTMRLVGPDGAAAGESDELVCSYTGEPLEPGVELSLGDTTFVEGQDYTVSYVNNVEDGTAEVRVLGQGSLFGVRRMTFAIEDHAAWGLLYEDGMLYLKANHHKPDAAVLSADRDPVAAVRWLDAEGVVATPLREQAAAAKRVVIDPSLASFVPTSADEWFAGLTALEKVEGWENLNTSALTSMRNFLKGCTALRQLDLTGLCTSNVRDISGLLADCSMLEELNLSNADFRALTAHEGMLEGCPNLKTITCAEGWLNSAAAPLTFDRPAMRVKPTYERMAQGAVLPAGSGTYRVSDLALQLARVEIPAPTYTCTGKPLMPKPIVRLGELELVEGVDYQVAYTNNVLPGTAKATITGIGIMSGGLEVPFTIVAAVTHVGDRLSYTEGGVTYTMVITSVTGEGQVARAMLTQVTVNRDSITALALPSSCTIGNLKVTVTAVSSKLRGNFRNVSTVTIGAKVTTIGARAFSRAPKVKKLIIKSSRLRSVKNCLAGSRVTRVQVKVRLTKSLKNKYKTWFTKNAGKRSIRYTYG